MAFYTRLRRVLHDLNTTMKNLLYGFLTCFVLLAAQSCSSSKDASEEMVETVEESAAAQQDRRSPRTAPTAEQLQARNEKMTDDLGLSGEKKAKFLAIQKKYEEKTKALMKSSDKMGMRDKMKALRDDQLEEMSQILDTNTLEAFEVMTRRVMNRGARKGGRRGE